MTAEVNYMRKIVIKSWLEIFILGGQRRDYRQIPAPVSPDSFGYGAKFSPQFHGLRILRIGGKEKYIDQLPPLGGSVFECSYPLPSPAPKLFVSRPKSIKLLGPAGAA